MEPKVVKIDFSVVNAMVAELAKLPYNQVAKLIADAQQSVTVNNKPEDTVEA